jgi:hypothetical protein
MKDDIVVPMVCEMCLVVFISAIIVFLNLTFSIIVAA